MHRYDLDDLQLLSTLKQVNGRGGFLLSGDPVNCMTIGYCLIGYVWYRPICTVFVRKSRYSYETMQGGAFTVSIPKQGEMSAALQICGKQSGRTVDKRSVAGITIAAPLANGIGGVSGCDLTLECRTVYSVEGELSRMDPTILQKHYNPNREKLPNGDPHMIYFGEILAAYGE